MQNIFLSNSKDPLLSTADVQNQIAALEKYKEQILDLSKNPMQKQDWTWTKIDDEVSALTEHQRNQLFEDKEYAENAENIQAILQAEYLKAIMPLVENTKEGKQLLEKQYELVKVLKRRVIDSSNKEMELFNKFQEYSKDHPSTTWEDFKKTSK